MSVGLLDIFGFENFPRNSFEQICINIANEQIQYYFNQHIFTWEQQVSDEMNHEILWCPYSHTSIPFVQEYMAEGVPVDLVEFSDNRPVLDLLLSRPLGLLALLDEESRFPRATDRTFIEKCHSNIKSKHYIRPKSDAICFAIHHFAGRVVYYADGFLEKNRNFLPAEVIQLVRQSQLEMVRFLFQCPITKTGNLYSALPESAGARQNLVRCDTKERYNSRGLASQSRAQQTVATYFRYSLMDLLQKMVAGAPQFVRCIKPNETRRPRSFEVAKVLKQLRYTGVLETIRIRQHGFSHRFAFGEFMRRYAQLAYGYGERGAGNQSATRENCRLVLKRLRLDGWALGKSKVFLKYYHVELLAKLFEERVRKVVLVQACVRRWLARVRYLRTRTRVSDSAVTLQRHVRGWLTRRRLHAAGEREREHRERAERAERVERELQRQRRAKEADEAQREMESRAKVMAANAQQLRKVLSSEAPPVESRRTKARGQPLEEGQHVDRAAALIQTRKGLLLGSGCFYQTFDHYHPTYPAYDLEYRAYSLWKNRGGGTNVDVQAQIKAVLGKARNRSDAMLMLMREGFRTEEAERIVLRHFKQQQQQQQPMPMTPRDQHVDLIAFSHNVGRTHHHSPTQ